MSIYEIALALVLFLAGIGTGWAGQRLLGQVADLKKQVKALEEDVKGQKEQQDKEREKQECEIRALRDRRRLPHAAAEGLEDSIAITLDLIREWQAYRGYIDARLSDLYGTLKTTRNEPSTYEGKPNNKRLYEERKKG